MQKARILLPTAALFAIAILFLVHKHTQTAHRPTASVFRSYLADPTSRMVVYSPGDDVLADPQHLLLHRQLATIRQKFDGLSLYQCTPSTPDIVNEAQSLGFRAVLLTIWDPLSESELATASSILQAHQRSMAIAVSIGSEGLMQKRYTLQDIRSARATLIDRSPSGDAVETTTTEPWWLFLHPENAGLEPSDRRALRAFGDFTSVNIHVVWDTDIADPDIAASWTRDRANEVRASIPRPLLIREAGFPGAGLSPRKRRDFTYNRILQAAFWRSWFALQQRPPIAVFEAIDNPQKHWRDFEASWGLLTPDLEPWPAWLTLPLLPHP